MTSSQGRVFLKLIMMSSNNTMKRHPHPSLSQPISTVRQFSFSSMDGDDSRSVGQPVREPSVLSNDDGDGRKSCPSLQNPPEPVPNRPVGGVKPLNHQFNNHQPSFRNPNRARRQPPNNDLLTNENINVGDRESISKPSQSFPFEFLNRTFAGDQKKKSDDDQLDNHFLDKFKLGIDNKNKSNSTKTSQLPQQEQGAEERTNLEQPPQDADEIFKKMKETGLIPNAVAMLDGLCKDGLVQEAMKLFGLMREKGTIPEVVIYTAVVDGFCKAQRLDDAKRIFRKMQNNGISPNAFSYTVLIQGLYKWNKSEDAIQFCIEMLEAGHSPNVTTFVGFVDGLCREKGVEEAQSVIATLRERGFFFNEKAVREFLDKKAPFSSQLWEAIFGKKTSQRLF